MAEVVVVGAGFGGLASAIGLAGAGADVTVFEAGSAAGGKAGSQTVDGVRFDTGPSVLTLPEVLDQLLEPVGVRLDELVTLVRPEPAFRYWFPDGASVDVHHELEATLESIHHALGATAREQFADFMRYGREIWESAAPRFVMGDAPTVGGILAMGPAAWASVATIDPVRTMWGAIQRRVPDPHLRAILARFATYNGSDVRQAPATLNCIGHVEMGLGGFGVQGGMTALVDGLVQVATSLGVTICYDEPVVRLRRKGKRIVGVELERGFVTADAVVVNADVGMLRQVLDPAASLPPPGPPSMSGWTAVYRAGRNDKRAGHTVVFSDPYLNEFRDIFDRDIPPTVPTVYLCDQHLAHQNPGWRDDTSPVFVMANAPAENTEGTRDSWATLAGTVRSRALDAGVLGIQDHMVWSRTPRDLAVAFPGSRGSIYGAASHGLQAAFRRPPNRVAGTRGLYLASGSAHPGGGVPLAVQSGRAAVRALLEDVAMGRSR